MKIELKNTDFKIIYEFLYENRDNYCPVIKDIIVNQLQPQYEKAFLKYQDEKQKFNAGDNIEFGRHNEKTNGKIIKVSRLTNGKYRYLVKYKYQCDIDKDTGEEIFTDGKVYLTEKNIRKI